MSRGSLALATDAVMVEPVFAPAGPPWKHKIQGPSPGESLTAPWAVRRCHRRPGPLGPLGRQTFPLPGEPGGSQRCASSPGLAVPACSPVAPQLAYGCNVTSLSHYGGWHSRSLALPVRVILRKACPPGMAPGPGGVKDARPGLRTGKSPNDRDSAAAQRSLGRSPAGSLRRPARSKVADQDARQEYQQTSQHHLEESSKQRRVHITVSDPGNGSQFRGDYHHRGPGCHPKVGQQKG